MQRLDSEAFYIPAHQIIFELVLEFCDENKPIDFPLLKQALKDRGRLEQIGGPEYLSSLYGFVPTAANAEHYIEIVREKWIARKLALACQRIFTALCNRYEDNLVQLREELVQLATGKWPAEQEQIKLSGRTLLDFLDLEIDPISNLLGNRWLSRDGSAFVISPSGHGKSSLAVHLAICWGIGRIAFGIKPSRPQRILIIESEDDDAETSKFVQMVRKMKLTKEEQELCRANIRFEYRRDIAGAKFIPALDALLTQWPPDIVMINPLSGFLLCDLKDDEKVNEFLRGQLDPLMAKHRCAPLIFHHTPKTNFTKLDKMQWYDWMYAMSGCAGLTNWARAVLVIAPSKNRGTYRFIAAKRFAEIQWTEHEYWFSHSTETISIDGKEHQIIQWVPASADQIAAAKPAGKGRKQMLATREIWEKMSLVDLYTRQSFEQWAAAQFGIGYHKAWDFLKLLCQEGLVQVSETKRPGTNPLKLYKKLIEPALEAVLQSSHTGPEQPF